MQLELFDDLNDQIKMVEDDLKKSQKIYNDLITIRNNTCKHEYMTKKQYYFSGSYYDKAYTDTWYKCEVCGYESKKETEYHSWYG